VPVSDPAVGATAPGAPVLYALLGASNLARAERAVRARLRRALGAKRVEFVTASGPGRAYCVSAGILNVRYPPIAGSGVVETARRRRAAGARVVALVTDIGNDIMHGVPGERLTATLDELLSDLVTGAGARVLATTIPVDVERDVGHAEFCALRTLFFPFSRVRRREAARAVREVNRFLEERASSDVQILAGLRDCLGWDRIHYGLGGAHRAWTRISDRLLELAGATPAPAPALGPLDLAASGAAHLTRLAFREVLPLGRGVAPLRVELS